MLARQLVKAARPLSRAMSAAAVDGEHSAWLKAVSSYPIVIPHFEWTLEWVLPTPVPLHQFEQSPVAIEVTDRNADPDALVYSGPNVVGGYIHPISGKVVSQAEHKALAEASDKLEASHAKPAAAHHH